MCCGLRRGPAGGRITGLGRRCPWGTKPTRFEGVCISGAGGGSAPVIPVPPPAGGGATIVNNPNGYDTVNGVPCTPEHWGACYGNVPKRLIGR